MTSFINGLSTFISTEKGHYRGGNNGMTKKIVWLVVSCLMVLSLLVASCSSDEKEPAETENGNQSPTTETEPEGPDIGEGKIPVTTDEEPQYGGTLSLIYGLDIMGYDPLTTPDYWDVAGHITHDELLEGDWSKGPAGTGEFTWKTNDVYRWDSKSGALAESFEILSPGHMIFHIRQGVHFGLNPDSEASRLVNGRELTGEDVYWNIDRWITGEGSQIARSARTMAESIEYNLLDEWTLELKVPVEESIYLAAYLVDWNAIWPKEVIETYGTITDWQNSVGTGPYFITDYTRSSAVTFEKNPNYWETDPVGAGKGNRLPYIDTVKYLIIPDLSTQEAAVRTGQVDAHFGITLDTIQNITSTASDIIVAKQIPAAAYSIAMHTDDPDSPFGKKEVRQALQMAINYDEIIEDFYQGEAEIPSYPITPEPELAAAFLSLDEAPKSVNDLYTYNPDMAKQLLTDAGYPKGFSATITCVNPNVDYLSIVAAMWDEIGVTLNINPLETGAYNSMWAARNYEGLFYTLQPSSGTYVRMLALTGSSVGGNLSFVDDAQVNQAKTDMLAAFAAGDQEEVDRIHKALMPYVMEQAWAIPSPAAYTFTAWWPWLKGYHGEYSNGICNEFRWSKYAWIDQALKKSMGFN